MTMHKKLHFVSLVILIVVLAVSLASCCGLVSDSLCSVEKTATLPSPDGKNKVVVRVRNCGATTDYVTEVSIVPLSRENITGYGNTFRIKGFLDIPDDLEITWQSNNKLLITYPADQTIYKSEDRVRRVTVTYQEREKGP